MPTASGGRRQRSETLRYEFADRAPAVEPNRQPPVSSLPPARGPVRFSCCPPASPVATFGSPLHESVPEVCLGAAEAEQQGPPPRVPPRSTSSSSARAPPAAGPPSGSPRPASRSRSSKPAGSSTTTSFTEHVHRFDLQYRDQAPRAIRAHAPAPEGLLRVHGVQLRLVRQRSRGAVRHGRRTSRSAGRAACASSADARTSGADRAIGSASRT